MARILLINSLPKPGTEQICSTTIVPVIKLTRIGPKIVITGIKALRNACLKINVLRSKPLAIARVIYSLFNTEIISVRVKRATLAITLIDKAITGNIDEKIGFISSYIVGKIRRSLLNKITSNNANTNDGIDTPKIEIIVAIVSQIVFLFNAATIPSNIPTNVPKIHAAIP